MGIPLKLLKRLKKKRREKSKFLNSSRDIRETRGDNRGFVILAIFLSAARHPSIRRLLFPKLTEFETFFRVDICRNIPCSAHFIFNRKMLFRALRNMLGNMIAWNIRNHLTKYRNSVEHYFRFRIESLGLINSLLRFFGKDGHFIGSEISEAKCK